MKSTSIFPGYTVLAPGLALVLILWLTVQKVLAQEPAGTRPAPPSPPYVAPMPDRIAFVKKFIYPAPPSTPANATGKDAEAAAAIAFIAKFGRIQHADIVKTGSTVKIDCVYIDGRTSRRWEASGLMIVDNPARRGDIQVTPLEQFTHKMSERANFLESDWADRDSFAEEKPFDGHACYVYKKNGSTAYIDKETRLPVACQTPDFTVSYTYKDVPAGNLQVPAEYARAIEQTRNSMHGGAPR